MTIGGSGDGIDGECTDECRAVGRNRGACPRARGAPPGMTQVELAAGRFTKQYVSQIERGEVVPSDELLDWLAERLGVERLLPRDGARRIRPGAHRALPREGPGPARYPPRRRGYRLSGAPGIAPAGGAPRSTRLRGDARRGMGADPDGSLTEAARSRRGTLLPRTPSDARGRSRDRVPDGGLLLLALDDWCRTRRVRPGARAARRDRRAERPAALGHPPVALAVLPQAARLRGGPETSTVRSSS